MEGSRGPLRAGRFSGSPRVGRIAGAARLKDGDRYRRRQNQQLPRRARADRMRVQGVRRRTRRLSRAPGRARDPVVLEVRRGSHYPLARAGNRVCRPAAAARGHKPHVRGFWLFVHVMGFVAWLGGGVAVMLCGITAKYFPPDQRLAVYRVISVVTRNLIGPGAVLVVVSGFVLSVPYFRSATVPSWLLAMQGLGLLGAIVAIGIVTPTAARLGRLELDPRGELPEGFGGLRKRQAIFAAVSGVFGLLALLSGTVFRYEA